MSSGKDDKSLEEYLEGGSDLSRRYLASKQAEPPRALDDAIIKAARTAVARPGRPVSRSWYVPLSLAAVVVIGVSIVFRMYEYKGDQLLSEPVQDRLLNGVENGKDYRQSPAEPRGTVSSPPQTTQPAPDKDEAEHETRRDVFFEERAAMPAKKQAPAPAVRMPEKEAVMPQAATRVDMPASDELSTNRLKQEEAAVEEKARATAEPPVSSAPEVMEPGQPAAPGAAGGARYSAIAWLAAIKQAWESGNKDEAIAGLKQFLAAYPDYPHGEIVKQLPEDFDPGTYISGFRKN